ncbi:4Fe-4S dicluster domain-containing protein [Desulfuribacillus stibiiarsenatis]|uniref:4Fe-4S dicluster domain-containing protein n=1 Tax=Desulfuribacillus stibiiarsenatis TaxID=1390249 RepID=UPI00114C863F|nr:4Fe-4S dicluster domain-containing protein [Desulfuribacillus stibiiarsenatis]
MTRYGMLIDNSSCVGCHACQIACQNQWQLPYNEHFIDVHTFEKGTYPNVNIENFTTQCNHCDDPPCMRICPTYATYKRQDGLVLVEEKKCIGCKGCIVACPYNARIWSEKYHVPEKCKFCADFIATGETPACVNTCVTKARMFGDLDDPNSEISKEIIKKRAVPLKAELGTKPRIYYIRQI